MYLMISPFKLIRQACNSNQPWGWSLHVEDRRAGTCNLFRIAPVGLTTIWPKLNVIYWDKYELMRTACPVSGCHVISTLPEPEWKVPGAEKARKPQTYIWLRWKPYTATPTKTQPFALSSTMFFSKITNAYGCSSLGKSSMK